MEGLKVDTGAIFFYSFSLFSNLCCCHVVVVRKPEAHEGSGKDSAPVREFPDR